MTPEQYAKTKQIFLDACDKPVGERGEFVAKASSGDAEIKREVESLLKEHHSGAPIIPDDPEPPLGPMSALLSHAGIDVNAGKPKDASAPDDGPESAASDTRIFDEAHDQTSGTRSGIVD